MKKYAHSYSAMKCHNFILPWKLPFNTEKGKAHGDCSNPYNTQVCGSGQSLPKFPRSDACLLLGCSSPLRQQIAPCPPSWTQVQGVLGTMNSSPWPLTGNDPQVILFHKGLRGTPEA